MVEVIERHGREASDDPHLGGVQWQVHSGPDVIPRAMSGSCCFRPFRDKEEGRVRFSSFYFGGSRQDKY